MARCDFCQKRIEPGTGKLYIKKDGKTFDFCSKKCETHMLKLKHKPRTTRWTLEYRKLKKEQLAHNAAEKKPAQQEMNAVKKKPEHKKPEQKEPAHKKPAEKVKKESTPAKKPVQKK
ncbi:ribosomal protein L24e family protein [Candidatus Woesearchaeota archaeon]|nr:ribosomal protein L24e family protein [Candidatus Woesearchaeota archaeon]